MDRKLRDRTQRYIDLIVDHSLTTAPDAGWHMTHPMAKLIQFQGDLPRTDGLAHGHDQVMINAISHYREQHHLLDDALKLFAKLTTLQRLCLYVFNRFHKVNSPEGKPYTERELAAMIGLTVYSYLGHKKRGFAKYAALIEAEGSLVGK